jgi:hypothetical protein
MEHNSVQFFDRPNLWSLLDKWEFAANRVCGFRASGVRFPTAFARVTGWKTGQHWVFLSRLVGI